MNLIGSIFLFLKLTGFIPNGFIQMTHQGCQTTVISIIRKQDIIGYLDCVLCQHSKIEGAFICICLLDSKQSVSLRLIHRSKSRRTHTHQDNILSWRQKLMVVLFICFPLNAGNLDSHYEKYHFYLLCAELSLVHYKNRFVVMKVSP